MDSKKDNNSLMTNKENYLINSVFVKDTELQFIFKKTEKIVTAIYLITNFFTIEEPLKWSLRKSANSLLQNILSFNQSSLSDKEKETYELNSCLLEMSSLFDLAYYSGFISTMNYQILSAEIGNLSLNVGNYNSKILTSNKNLFSTDYFHVQNFSDLDSKTDFEQTNFKKTDFKQTSTKGQQSPIKDTNTRAGMTYRGNVSDFKNYIKDMSNKGQQNQKDTKKRL